MNSSDHNSPMLLEELRTLETELHKHETRSNRKRMETLLHPDFVEFGRSGTRYTRADILKEFDPNSVLPAVHSCDFDLVVLAQGIALLTYLSAHVEAGGDPHRHTLRSSLWVAPETSQRVVEDAVKQVPTPMAPGPVKPTWESLKENYKVPA